MYKVSEEFPFSGKIVADLVHCTYWKSLSQRYVAFGCSE